MGRPFTVAATSGDAALRHAIAAREPKTTAAIAAVWIIFIDESLL
jgi:hypothetical protein